MGTGPGWESIGFIDALLELSVDNFKSQLLGPSKRGLSPGHCVTYVQELYQISTISVSEEPIQASGRGREINCFAVSQSTLLLASFS